MKPIYNDNHRTLYNKACIDMSEIPDESIQCVVTSPPYWGLRKYDGEQDLIWGGQKRVRCTSCGGHGQHYEGDFKNVACLSCGKKTLVVEDCLHVWEELIKPPSGGRNLPDNMPNTGGNKTQQLMDNPRFGTVTNTCQLCGAWKGAYGLEPTPEMYVQHTVEIMREVKRVLRKDGVVFWNIGDSYNGASMNQSGNNGYNDGRKNRSERFSTGGVKGLKPKDLCLIPFRVAIALQDDGWWVRSDIIWSKNNPMPESVTDRPTNSHEYIFMLTKSSKYYWDSFAVRENTNTSGATDFASLGSSALAPEFSTTLDTDYDTADLRGELNFSQSEITINGSVAFKAKSFKIIKAISLTIINEIPERHFMIDLQSDERTASLAFITSTLKGLSADNTPVRATIVNTSASVCGAIGTDSMFTVPCTDTSPATETMSQSDTLLAHVADKGLPTLVAIHSDALSEPLIISGTFRSSHIAHDTINTNINQGRNIRSVWTFPTQPYASAHFAVFPEKLPETCIKAATPEYGCCSKCGAPWERMVEKNGTTSRDRLNEKGPSNYHKATGSGLDYAGGHSDNMRETKTLGWQPTCKCNAGRVPSTVLDPFCGAGTTMWVASRLNRRAVGYEISEKYCELIIKRNRQQIFF